VQKYGAFVELFDEFVEGLVPIGAFEEMAEARCVYREHDHAIVAILGGEGRRGGGRRRQVKALAWRLGDRIRVRAERIDPMRRRVEFALLANAAVPASV
jgi:exoribonuclease R